MPQKPAPTPSNTESKLRSQLIAAHAALFKEQSIPNLLSCIRKQFPDMATAYILNWTPEQGEDIYLILIDNHTIFKIEINKQDESTPPTFLKIPITEYKKGLSKAGQIKLSAALDLANKEIYENNR